MSKKWGPDPPELTKIDKNRPGTPRGSRWPKVDPGRKIIGKGGKYPEGFINSHLADKKMAKKVMKTRIDTPIELPQKCRFSYQT
jgi:hypothetical protein